MQRIDCKIALTTFKVLTTHQPAYLNSFLTENVPKRVLRSSISELTLSVPFVKSVLSSCASSSCAPRLWNGYSRKILDYVVLPNNDPVSLSTFKRLLNTKLFIGTFGTSTTQSLFTGPLLSVLLIYH